MNPFPLIRAVFKRNLFTALLFMALIACAAALGITISTQERALRHGSARAADSFDLIVAAPGSQTDILFAVVYLDPTAVELLPPEVAARVLSDPNAAFAAPIGFGDSHDGNPVVGTTAEFVEHLGNGLAEGRVFAAMDEAVVGALSPAMPGDRLEIRHGHADDLLEDADSHGDEDAPAHLHDDVLVVGRMQPTGTPWDRAVVVPIEYIWSAHAMGTGHPIGDDRIGAPWQADLLPGLPAIVVKPESIAAAYGLRNRYRTAEATAFFPAEVLVELYAILGNIARIMSALTLAAQALVVAAILAGLLAALDLQRQRFAVLRALGAPALYIFAIVWLYVGALIVSGAVIGLPLGWAMAGVVSALIARETGVAMIATIGLRELALTGILLGLGLVLALIPAVLVYRRPVVEGLR